MSDDSLEIRDLRDISSDIVFSGMPKESRMLGMKRAVALMLTAFLLLSALSVSTMASDKAAASGSSEAAYFDRLIETAPIDEAASDIGAEKEVETVQEYEKGAGDGTGALFGCETGAGDEADTIYESETGAGDETGALFGYGAGGESAGTDEEQDGLTEIPAMAAAPEETGSGTEEENTADEDYVDDLTVEMAGTAYDGGEMPVDGIPADELYGEETGAEDADAENSGSAEAFEAEAGSEEAGAEDADAENVDGGEAFEAEPGPEEAGADGTDFDSINDPALYGDENTSEDTAVAEEEPDGSGETDAADQGMESSESAAGEEPDAEEPTVGEESPGQADPEETDNGVTDNEATDNEITDNEVTDNETVYSSPEAAGENYGSEAIAEDAAADSGTYSEETAAAPETGNAADSADPAGPAGGNLPEALSDQTQTGPDSEVTAASVDQRAALTAMSLSLTDQVVMNIYVRADDSVDDDDYIEFSYAGETLQKRVGDADLNRMTLGGGEAFDVLTFALPLRMRQMTDDVTFRMVVDGVEGTPKTRTVRSYADQILQGNFSEEQKEVTRAMLNCGSCAQEYFGYNTDRPANAGIYGPGEDPVRDWEDPDLSSYDYFLHQDSVLGFEFCETTLELQEDISLICYFRVGERHFFDNFTNLFYHFSLKGSDLDLTPGYDRDKGMYYVRIPHIMPYELDEMFEIEVTSHIVDSSKTIATLRYSPLTYCRDMLASDSSSPEIKNLCRSLYYYCNAANIMRGESSSAQEK